MKTDIHEAAENGNVLLIFVVVLLADVVWQLIEFFGG